MLTSLLLLLFFCLLQMLPWIGELLVTQGDQSAPIWWIGALFSTSGILMLARWANTKGLSSIRLDLSGWRKRTVVYAFLLGLVSYGAVFLIRLAIGGLEVVGMPPLSRLWAALAGSLLTTFYIAFSEEVIFRGFVFSNFAAGTQQRLQLRDPSFSSFCFIYRNGNL